MRKRRIIALKKLLTDRKWHKVEKILRLIRISFSISPSVKLKPSMLASRTNNNRG